MPKIRYTRAQFEAEYPNDDACLQALFMLRFGKRTCCHRCGVVAAQYMRVSGRRSFACVHCRHQIYPTAGTVMHRSTTPIKLWFRAIYSFSISKNNVSAKELERELGVTYKCALRVARKLRETMPQQVRLLHGIVEADEAYYGGRRRSSNWSKDKTPMLGAVERGGDIRVWVVDYPTRKNVEQFIGGTVRAGSTLNTDESNLYKWTKAAYTHRTTKHGNYEFVRGDVTSNTIEGFWGHLKPSLVATHRAVSRKYLQLYVNEFVWKYNHRREPYLYHSLLEAVAQPVRVPY